MAFQILKPEITNISKAVLDAIKYQWQFWAILLVTFIVSFGLVIWIGFSEMVFAPFLAVILYVTAVRHKIISSFWKRFAEINGWAYEYYGSTEQEQGVMFRQGEDRNISHIITGNIDDRRFRIFSYNFSIGSGKRKKTYYYIVFAFRFNGAFPHIYLNNKHNSYSISAGETIPLPVEFEKNFSLSAPRKYEIEALAIFTPDVLVGLLDNGFAYDVEFVNQEVLIFTDGQINDFGGLERAFDQALKLEDLLDEKLDRFKFQQIGDMPHTL